MYLESVISFVLSCIAGGIGAGLLVQIFKEYNIYERTTKLDDEENTDEATAIVMGKDKWTQSQGGPGTGNVAHFEVSYKFSAEAADGSPCSVQVRGREIDEDTWKGLAEGCTVQVIYLAGRPGSCRLKDMVEKEKDNVGRCCLLNLCGVLFFIFCVGLYASIMLARAAEKQDPQEKQQIIVGLVVGFFLFFCVGSILCVGLEYRNGNTDNIHGGEVILENLADSNYDKLVETPRSS